MLLLSLIIATVILCSRAASGLTCTKHRVSPCSLVEADTTNTHPISPIRRDESVCSGSVALLIGTVILFPLPSQDLTGSDLVLTLKDRTTDSDDVAISSRWKLLTPMINKFSKTHSRATASVHLSHSQPTIHVSERFTLTAPGQRPQWNGAGLNCGSRWASWALSRSCTQLTSS